MASLKQITEAEWPLLEVVWQESPLSAREIHDRLTQDRKSHIQTVRTLLDRLAGKEILRREKLHGIYVFHPLVGREACVKQQSQSFLKRFFGGKPAAVASYFLQEAELPKEELQRLREMLDAKIRQCDEGGSDDA